MLVFSFDVTDSAVVESTSISFVVTVQLSEGGGIFCLAMDPANPGTMIYKSVLDMAVEPDLSGAGDAETLKQQCKVRNRSCSIDRYFQW